MYAIGRKTIKEKLLVVVVWVTTVIIISAASIILLSTQYHQMAQAFPCIGDGTKEYCTGYHDGAVQARRDFNVEHDIDQHRCTRNSTDYCNGYNRGYNDEADFLG